MFSGIVEETARVQSIAGAENQDGLSIVVRSALDHSSTGIGDSIAIDGVCLTVTRIAKVCASHKSESQAWELAFDLGSETMRCTTLRRLEEGGSVHLERSLAIGDRIHGHFVTGHVDTTATLISREVEGNTQKLTFQFPKHFEQYVVPKGSVALSGVSLTVGETESGSFAVYIIPHTQEVTNLNALSIGEAVNIEFDPIARYLVRFRELVEKNSDCSGDVM